MAKYGNMSIEELQAVRDEIAVRMAADRKEFMAAGKALGRALANTPEAKLLAKRATIDAQLAALSTAGEESDA